MPRESFSFVPLFDLDTYFPQGQQLLNPIIVWLRILSRQYLQLEWPPTSAQSPAWACVETFVPIPTSASPQENCCPVCLSWPSTSSTWGPSSALVLFYPVNINLLISSLTRRKKDLWQEINIMLKILTTRVIFKVKTVYVKNRTSSVIFKVKTVYIKNTTSSVQTRLIILYLKFFWKLKLHHLFSSKYSVLILI